MWMGGNQRGVERYPGLIMRKESEYAFKNKIASVGMDPDCGDGSSGQERFIFFSLRSFKWFRFSIHLPTPSHHRLASGIFKTLYFYSKFVSHILWETMWLLTTSLLYLTPAANSQFTSKPVRAKRMVVKHFEAVKPGMEIVNFVNGTGKLSPKTIKITQTKRSRFSDKTVRKYSNIVKFKTKGIW